MQALGQPQNSFPSIHIAGTNGKGSVAAALHSVLREEGFTVGLYTSPHLVRLNERFQINGRTITDHELLGIVCRIRLVQSSAVFPFENLTQFEFLTAVAFVWFADNKIDLAVIETGLGGRLDATNVMENVLASVITNIGLDHTQWLGKTHAKIAAEKAGIIKTGIPIVTAATGKALHVIEHRAKLKKSRLVVVRYADQARNSKILSSFSLFGLHQKLNAAVALRTLQTLRFQRRAISKKAIISGFKKTFWSGRYERIKFRGLHGVVGRCILDGAHNPAAIQALIRSLKSDGIEKVNLLFGVLRDKDYRSIARQLTPIVESVVTVPLPTPRHLPARAGAQLRVWRKKSQAATSVRRGWEKIVRLKCPLPILVTGSLYLVGELKKILNP